MQVITVASDINDKGFTSFLKPSCEFYKLDFLVLEYDEPFFSNRLKDALLDEYLKDVHDDEIIFFTDATDAAFLCGESEILKKFYAFNSPLVFSAEVNCWPDKKFEPIYPQSPGIFKYLNSGGFIGRAGYIKEVYKKYPVFTTVYDAPFEWSNQYYWNYLFLQEHQDIRLDHTCEIFYNTTFIVDDYGIFRNKLRLQSEVEMMFNRERQRLDNEITFDNNRVKSNITSSLPCHIHFPGPISKQLMNRGYFDRVKPWNTV